MHLIIKCEYEDMKLKAYTLSDIVHNVQWNLKNMENFPLSFEGWTIIDMFGHAWYPVPKLTPFWKWSCSSSFQCKKTFKRILFLDILDNGSLWPYGHTDQMQEAEKTIVQDQLKSS